jgi:hypothetical protein
MVGIGSIWLRIWTGGGLMWRRWWTSGFHKMLGSSRIAAQLAASQEGLSSMSEWVSNNKFISYVVQGNTVNMEKTVSFFCIFTRFKRPGMKKVFSDCRLFVPLQVLLASTRTAGRISFLFGILEYNHHLLLPDEYEHSNSENMGPPQGPHTQIRDLLEGTSNDFHYFS